MPCNCAQPHTIMTEYHSIVCTKCGVESPYQVIDPSFDTSYNPTPGAPMHSRVYNRPDRWKTLVRKITGLHPGPPRHDPIWKYLANAVKRRKKKFGSVDAITQCLRNSKIKHKHYQCLHSFAKAFLKDYDIDALVSPPYIVERNLNMYFTHISDMWKKSEFTQFFSYSWLLEQAIYMFRHIEYLRFIKLLSCPKRRNKYHRMLLTLYETHAGNGGRGSQGSRFPNVLSLEEIPRNLLWMRPPHDERSRVLSSEERAVEDLELGPGCKCVTPRGAVQTFSSSLEQRQEDRERLQDQTENPHSGSRRRLLRQLRGHPRRHRRHPKGDQLPSARRQALEYLLEVSPAQQ